MDAKAKEFFVQLVETPGVSGYEQRVQELVRSYAGDFVDDVRTDLHGNVILSKNPAAPVRVMLAGHADQIGLIVSSIDDDGYLYTQTVGGWDPQQLVGQRMTVWTRNGPIPGVIARKAIHLLEESERKQVVKAKDLWIDIGASDEEQAGEMVAIGDPVTLELRYQELLNGLANSPAMDNRTGLWVVVEAMRRAVEQGVDCGLFAVSTVQEEIGLRGAKTAAFDVDPHVGIAVDVTHATDCPTVDTRQLGKIKLGGGPVVVRGPNVNPVVSDRLLSLSEQHEIPVQRVALGRAAPNDSNALQVTRGGVAAGIVAIPNRYMHSAVETIALADIDAAASLLAKFVGTIQTADEFIPTTAS
ncbi:MAG: M42 family metallopeptidase [Mariniblastus sp.]|nr:M42 family metallopeptidase [Mariniblastus sp.]